MVKVFEIQNEVKSIMKDLDLYGIEVLFTSLKKYPFISWCKNSIPKEGSPTTLTQYIKNTSVITEVKKCIYHKDGKITIFTNISVYQFFGAGQQVK